MVCVDISLNTDLFVNHDALSYDGCIAAAGLPMPNPNARRPAKFSSATRSSPAGTEREPRGARRRRETRSRLLMAALKLMAERGMEGVAINEITEAADVGFGSFYNHFDSKEAIYGAVLEWVFEDFADAMERVTGEISDPAEIIAVSTRYTIMRALREPVWGQFLVREGFSPRSVDQGLGGRLMRDIRKGVTAKRLNVADLLMSFVAVGGTTLGAISVGLQLGSVQGQHSATLKELGSNLERLPERTAAMALEALGLSRAEAEKIAHRPLPPVDLPLAANGLGAGQPSSKIHNNASEPRAIQRATRRRARA
jgi:AcrR family transcriptional regulator